MVVVISDGEDEDYNCDNGASEHSDGGTVI